jgi:hypothetical protein
MYVGMHVHTSLESIRESVSIVLSVSFLEITHISQLQSLIELTSTLGNSKLEDVYAAIATNIGAQGASVYAEATTELLAAGLDPTMYIVPTRYYQRRQRELARMEPERLAAMREQELHQIEIQRQQLELRKTEAAVRLAELTVHTREQEAANAQS